MEKKNIIIILGIVVVILIVALAAIMLVNSSDYESKEYNSAIVEGACFNIPSDFVLNSTFYDYGNLTDDEIREMVSIDENYVDEEYYDDGGYTTDVFFDNFTSTGTGEIMISAVPIDVTKEEFDEEWANIPSLMSEEFSEDIPGLDVSSAIQKTHSNVTGYEISMVNSTNSNESAVLFMFFDGDMMFTVTTSQNGTQPVINLDDLLANITQEPVKQYIM